MEVMNLVKGAVSQHFVRKYGLMFAPGRSGLGRSLAAHRAVEDGLQPYWTAAGSWSLAVYEALGEAVHG